MSRDIKTPGPDHPITPDAHRDTEAVWFYDDPYPAVAEIKGHVAFYSDRVELSVETADGPHD